MLKKIRKKGRKRQRFAFFFKKKERMGWEKKIAKRRVKIKTVQKSDKNKMKWGKKEQIWQKRDKNWQILAIFKKEGKKRKYGKMVKQKKKRQ